MKKLIMVAIVTISTLPAISQSAANTSAGTRPEKPRAVDLSYTIGAEDVISIAVWKEPDFSSTVPVRPDGKVALQLLGDVQAAGKTPSELAGDLTTLLKRYIEEPRVTVIVSTINSRRVFLLGEVARPGPIVITPGMTVLQAVAAAGGPTPYANTKKAYVLRNEGGQQTKVPFNYKEAVKGNAPDQNFVLKPGDTIVVP